MTIKTDAVIIGAGPVGLFSVFELGILGLNAHVIDNLDKIGGQCIELYPDKPIYDIPGVPNCTGELLIKNLLDQIKPFKPEFHLNQRVNEIKKNDKLWRVITSENKIFETPNIIIAGGVGSFEPRKVDIKNAEKFEGKGFYYSVKDKSKFKDQIIAIFGGGDSALDWTLELSNIAKKIYLIHRREDFKGAPHTLSKIKEIAKTGKIEIKTFYKLTDVNGDLKLNNIEIQKNNEAKEVLNIDSVIAFFGLKMELGPIANWGLNLEEKCILVNTKNFQTNEDGIFAIGDICTYPGKLKLILSGFHEGALAARECFARSRPNENYVFQYTTSSTQIHKRLGIK
ncbi:MAG: NAD(P)/FAD-dependent oxidoreductase [Candidatus Fonsibacter ubiquis]|jgi:thioredoxin reductase (NADPH)|nr:NAD(P)/FAD-dependent oxidoreductase [Candidatus Fonsibacter ubiquis]NCW70784.1 NAD(P)/FAD-dependent oxidoreductase [Pseudomonadota bacterium]NCU49607.1 NAD(P)/FAD-dependent oxidoreductase [Candidatus Fonsibacter ubiquis]NCU51020.1 NAD(P)/FAD-dependent oxidoreductase [Candidatus Fonsibacter ubiquis]NCU55638.1 NAD(P)/FAD-dependent oxidoreductase [Candidatus Fonsibacter ubiquis]